MNTNKTEFILIYVQDIFAHTNNFDCIRDLETFDLVYNYVMEVINKSLELYNMFYIKLEEDEVVNYVNYLTASTINLIDAYSYVEAAGGVKPNSVTLFYEDEKIGKIKAGIQQALNLLFKTSETYFSYETFRYKYERKGLKTVAGIQSCLEDDWGHEIFFDSLNIKAYYREKLFSQYNGYIVAIYSYNYYPYVANNNTAISRHFTGFKMFNSTYTEIEVKSIKSELRPIITYGIKDEGNANWVSCKRFDTSKNTTTLDDLNSETKDDENGIPFVNCTLSSFGEISIGNKESSSNVLLIILLTIVGIILLLALAFFINKILKKNQGPTIPSLETQQPSPLLGLILVKN